MKDLLEYQKKVVFCENAKCFNDYQTKIELSRLPPGPTRMKNGNTQQLILATFSPLIPNLHSDKSESRG